MARNRAANDDSKNDTANGKEKGSNGNGKGRKVAAAAKPDNKTEAAVSAGDSSTSQTGNPNLDWQREDVDILLAYRAQNMLDTPTSFRSIETQAVLNNPGIGRHSPSMIRKRPKRYVSKDLLATAVRKHFNAVAVNEQEVVLDFLYTVKNQDKCVKHPGLAGMAEGAPQRNFFKRFGIVLKNPEDRE